MYGDAETKKVIAGMLVENTGVHMLDSGGYSGRAWQRNQKAQEAVVAGGGDWIEWLDGRPEVEIDKEWETVTLDPYHYLVGRLAYDAELDAIMQKMIADSADDVSYLELMDEFVRRVPEFDEYAYGDGVVESWNSANGETLLGTTLQAVVWVSGYEDDVIALQIHGGADIRGGYTAPRIFRGSWYDLLNVASASFYCGNGHLVDLTNWEVTAYDDHGIGVETDVSDDWKVGVCPLCGEDMEGACPTVS